MIVVVGPARCRGCDASLVWTGTTWLEEDGTPHRCPSEVARLRELEAEFAAAGGRGVDLAEEIDRLRARLSA